MILGDSRRICNTFRYQNKSIAIGKEIAVISLTRKDLKLFSSVSALVSKLEACRKASPALESESLYAENQCRRTRCPDFWFTARRYITLECVSIRASNWIGGLLDSDVMHMHPALTLLPLAYGCVHFGALGLIFPTRTEKLLWEISCIILIAAAVGLGILRLIKSIDKMFSKYRKIAPICRSDTCGWTYASALSLYQWACTAVQEILQTLCGERWTATLKEWEDNFSYLLLDVLILIYCVARVYLIVESFISLRHVPIGVYLTPTGNFMSYIPYL